MACSELVAAMVIALTRRLHALVMAAREHDGS